jgi:chromosomal replication initiation ATPase DnaA
VKAETKAQLLEQYPPQPIGEEGLTTESVWDLTLQRLKEQVPAATYETWLQDTAPLQVTDRAAQIAVPNAFAVAWLERRMYREISQALRDVLQYEVDLQFVTAT